MPFDRRSLRRVRRGAFVAAVAALTLAPHSTYADQAPLRIGLIFSYSGSGASAAGKNFDGGWLAYMKQHGDTVAGRKIEIIKRDDTGIAPETARRLAQELIVQDHVDIIAGMTFTPNSIAVGTISTQAKKLFFIVNSATSGIIAKVPYAARFGFTTAQMTAPLATWAAKNGIKTAYSVFQDYGPGIDAGTQFAESFTAAGGKMLGEVRVPVTNSDFTAYVQRVKDAKPDAIYVFLNAGGGGAAMLKACRDAGFERAGIRILVSGDVVAENNLPGIGDAALGVVSSFNYSMTHDSKLNRDFVAAYQSVEPGVDPDFTSVAAYDTMAAIYKAAEAQKGNLDPDKTIELVRAMKFESPRGPIAIDPDTRDLIQNVYIRKTERRNGKLVNVEFATVPMVRDPKER